jgi:hypothetical protein
MQSPAPQAQRRKSQRYRVLKEGRVLVAGRYTIDCTVRDLSEAGAKIRVEGAPDLPGTLDLLIVREGLVYPCTLAWRKGDLAGLTFAGQPIKEHPSDDWD